MHRAGVVAFAIRVSRVVCIAGRGGTHAHTRLDTKPDADRRRRADLIGIGCPSYPRSRHLDQGPARDCIDFCDDLTAVVDAAGGYHVAADCDGGVHVFSSKDGSTWTDTLMVAPVHRTEWCHIWPSMAKPSTSA